MFLSVFLTFLILFNVIGYVGSDGTKSQLFCLTACVLTMFDVIAIRCTNVTKVKNMLKQPLIAISKENGFPTISTLATEVMLAIVLAAIVQTVVTLLIRVYVRR